MTEYKYNLSAAVKVLKKRYGISYISEHDKSLASAAIRNELNRALDRDIVSFDFESSHRCAPLERIQVSDGITDSPDEDTGKTVIHEAWLPVWCDEENTRRIFYFVQFTHGRIIHGLAWVDYDSVGRYRQSCVPDEPLFAEYKQLTSRALNIDYEKPTKPTRSGKKAKNRYRIYGKKGIKNKYDIVGQMIFGEYEGYDKTQGSSSLDSISTIVKLMTEAYRMFLTYSTKQAVRQSR